MASAHARTASCLAPGLIQRMAVSSLSAPSVFVAPLKKREHFQTVQYLTRRWSWAERLGLKSWEKVPVTFVGPGKNDSVQVDAKIGQTIYKVARENKVELEAHCEGRLACSTCHCILEASLFSELPAAKDDEEDMLDKAACLTDTSRLGCQVKVSEAFRGAVIRIPEETFNASAK